MADVTDEYIAQHPIPGPHGSSLWCCDDCAFKYEEKLRERIRADAAKIAERDAEIARLHSDHGDRVMALCETVKRLRAVAVKALPMNGKCSHGIAGRTCSDAVEELRVAVSALAPGDLGGEGE